MFKSYFLWNLSILAELRRLEGPPSGAPYSWLSWLTVLLVARTHDDDDDDDGGVAQDGCHTPNNRLTETCSLGLPCTSLILDIHVIINGHLSKQGIRWPVLRVHIAGSSLQLIEVKCCFEVDRWPSAGFSIGSRTHVWLICWKRAELFGSQLMLTQD